MSTNHNRIKVADLETNQPNKILKTNQNGEIEFSDANNLQTENYNALDCTTEGKTLDARQGKALKDMIDNNTVNLASDQETQITQTVPEDNKVVSRLKLFNWWQWVKSQAQNISGIWNFEQGIKVEKQNGNYTYTSELTEYGYSTQVNSIYGLLRSQYENGLIRWRNNNTTIELTHSGISDNLYIKLPNKSGVLSLKNDFITTAAGTTQIPSVIIPNGKLTTIPQDGAIERDENGQLWETHGGMRSQLSSAGKSQNYKVYSAILNQTGTNPPIATILENTMSSDIIFEYTSRGTYSGTLTNAFPEGKTFFITTAPNTPGSGNIFYIGRVDNNTINLSFRKSMTAFDEIVDAMMEIRVYK
jgi:hypothetical protein